jgi:acyl dehydratase
VRYFEDLEVGHVVELGDHRVTEEEITAFAREYDPEPFHMDPAAAEASDHGKLIASGYYTLCLANRIVVEGFRDNVAAVIGFGLDELRWKTPVTPGDRLVVLHEVVEKRGSESQPDRGVVVERIDVRNQRDDPVLTYLTPGMVKRRPEIDAADAG